MSGLDAPWTGTVLRYHATRFSLRHDILSQRECVGSQITSAVQAETKTESNSTLT